MNGSQLAFEVAGGEPSQEDIILDCLQANLGKEVPMPRLYEISGSMAIHSRIASIRKRGVRIINRMDRSTRPYKSFYQLVQP